MQAISAAALQLIEPIVSEVLSSLPPDACGDPAAVRQAWLDNMGRSIGGEAALGRIAAGKLAGQLGLRMTRSSPRMLAVCPGASAAADPSDLHLQGTLSLPVEAVLRLDAPADKPQAKQGLHTLEASSQLKPKAAAS